MSEQITLNSMNADRRLSWRNRLMAAVLTGAVSLATSACLQEGTVSAGPAGNITAVSCGEAGNLQPTYTGRQLADCLSRLAVKGRAPKTGYNRDQFGKGWDTAEGCDTRNRILRRDLRDVALDRDGCKVVSGTLDDPYTGKTIAFHRGNGTSDDVQIDHMVALGDAWQTGAQQLTPADRQRLANDPLNLEAVDGLTNEQKSDADAATWLPPNNSYRCAYVGHQILVKSEYHLWVTQPEHDAMSSVLSNCPDTELRIVS